MKCLLAVLIVVVGTLGAKAQCILSITSSNGTVLCPNIPSTLTLTPSFPNGTVVSYTWTNGTNNYTGNGSSINVPPNITATYQVVATTTTGAVCAGSIDIQAKQFSVNTPPMVDTVCANMPATLTAAIVGNSTVSSFAWYALPNYNSILGTAQSITVAPAVSTAYRVIATSGDGCVDSATPFVYVVPPFTATLTTGTSPICSGTSAAFTLQASIPTWNYVLYAQGAPGPGLAGIHTNNGINYTYINYTYTAGANYIPSAIFTSPEGCSDTVSTTIQVNQISVHPTASPDTVCPYATTMLTVVTTGNSALASVLWHSSPNFAAVGSTQSIIVAPSATTLYKVMVTSVDGCLDSNFKLVTVLSQPSATLTASPDTVDCPGTSVTLSVSGNGLLYGSNVMYCPGPLAPGIPFAPVPNTLPAFTVAPSVTSTYAIGVSDANGCQDTATVLVTVLTTPFHLIAAPNTICNGDSMQLMIVTANPVWTYNYLGNTAGFPGSSASGTMNTTSITLAPNVTTSYSVEVTSALGCIDTLSAIVTVNPTPAPPTVTTPITYCLNAPADTLTATGSPLNWYTAPVGMVPIGFAPTPLTNTADTTTYYVSQSQGTCESIRVPLDVIVTTGNLCDSVWPGDANSDFIVDANDVLEIGLGYNQTGTSRTGASLNFVSQVCTDWPTTLPINNNNSKHGDCDGDGTITATDTTAVSLNYGMVHLRQTHHAQSKITGLPNLYFGPVNTSGEVPIYFGDATSSMSNVYGLSAKINIQGTTTAQPDTIRFNNTSWLGDSTQTINFQKQVTAARTDMAIVRNNHTTITGNGPIAWLTVSPATPADTLLLYFSDVRVIDNNGTQLTGYNVLDDTLIAAPAAIGNILQSTSAVIIPNPGNGPATLQLTTQQAARYHLTLTDATGRSLWTSAGTAATGKNTIALPANIPSGSYNLTLQIANSAAPQTLRWLKLQ